MELRTRTIAKLIKQAEHFIEHRDWDEAAVRCYQILALDGDNADAQQKLRLIYLQRELVDDMRNSVERLSDPDDASPHQYRRRLAFSYRVLSRWDGWLQDDLEQTLAELSTQGITAEKPPYRVREGGSLICFVPDPDGYRIELIDRSGR